MRSVSLWFQWIVLWFERSKKKPALILPLCVFLNAILLLSTQPFSFRIHTFVSLFTEVMRFFAVFFEIVYPIHWTRSRSSFIHDCNAIAICRIHTHNRKSCKLCVCVCVFRGRDCKQMAFVNENKNCLSSFSLYVCCDNYKLLNFIIMEWTHVACYILFTTFFLGLCLCCFFDCKFWNIRFNLFELLSLIHRDRLKRFWLIF